MRGRRRSKRSGSRAVGGKHSPTTAASTPDSNARDWALRAVELGAGELLLTSVDREGTRKGFDLDFIVAIAGQVDVPVVVHGGAGSVADILAVAQLGVDGVALASVLHYGFLNIADVKAGLAAAGIEVRQ